MDGDPIRRKDNDMDRKPTLAVIGGSGLYQMAGLQDVTELEMMTPFGKPSSPVVVGTLAGHRLAFLARHGIGHFISPSEVNYRANIYALKSIGVNNHLCGLMTIESAFSHPSKTHRISGITAAAPP